MLKFIRGKGQQPSAERQKLQKELFSYRKTTQHGFPHKPSALAYDPKYKMLAIGTTTGGIKVFGKPGIEFYGHHSVANNSTTSDCVIEQLEWIQGTGRVISLTTANQLVLWEPSGSALIPIRHLPFEGKLKKISVMCASTRKDVVWLGTEGGNIYCLDLKSFDLKENVIFSDVIVGQAPETYKLNPGAIEAIKQIPNTNHLLIAYNRGLAVLWDLDSNSPVRYYIGTGHGQSAGLYVTPDGEKFNWYHADGSYAVWNLGSSDPPKDVKFVPYGPDPCKSIERLYMGKRGSDDIVVFSGGMPRSAYGDHYCVSVHCTDGNKTILDFTSKVIDFFVTYDDEGEEAQVLIVLLEEELCAFDLTDPKVPVVKTPYLNSVHASAVTCNHLVSQVSQEVYANIVKAGEEQDSQCSDIEWPIQGGYFPNENQEEPEEYEILLTGHEDGSVKFWDVTGVCMKLLYTFKTAFIFSNEPHQSKEEPADEIEALLRKAGVFDPYSDDPRLAIKKVTLCPSTGRLIVAGTAGQVVVAIFDSNPRESGPLPVTTMNLVSDRDGFVWKGGEKLSVCNKLLDDNACPAADPGVHLNGVLQIVPPANVTCLAIQSDWNLVAAGTAHGLVLFDYKNQHPVFHKCTLNPNDLNGDGEALSRRKSFKKSLRESFRRLRRGRSGRNQNNKNAQPTPLESRPIERQIEARPADDGLGSMVRCLLFAKTYISSVHNTSPTLWAATNASTVSVFLIHLPPAQSATEDAPQPTRRNVTVQLAKEIQLKHRAPVVGIAVFDSHGVPIDHPNTSAGQPPHRVLIASEEQFKVFSLPQLKPITKYKLTANEGARIRKLNFSTFSCPITPDMLQHGSPTKSISSNHQDANLSAASGDLNASDSPKLYQEMALLCLTNLGDIIVLTCPELKRQLNAAAVRREDINGISSLCFTNYGEAVYMMSSSEIQRISLSAHKLTAPEGAIFLEPLDDRDAEDIHEQNTIEAHSIDNENCIASSSEKIHSTSASPSTSATNGLTNGHDNRANETITSSMGDITVDSVRDHLNSTVTTLCSTTTEETIGRLTVLTTQTNQQITTSNMKDITDLSIANLKDIANSKTTESNKTQVVIESVLTNIIHEKTNGETIETTTTSACKESQL